jgi:hypothetical protein
MDHLAGHGAAGTPNKARAPNGVTLIWMPCWFPSWTIVAAAWCRPPTKAHHDPPPLPSGPASSATGWSKLMMNVRYWDGSPLWIPAGYPSWR